MNNKTIFEEVKPELFYNVVRIAEKTIRKTLAKFDISEGKTADLQSSAMTAFVILNRKLENTSLTTVNGSVMIRSFRGDKGELNISVKAFYSVDGILDQELNTIIDELYARVVEAVTNNI